MSQIRLFAEGSRAEAAAILETLDRRLGVAGLALATEEIDPARGRWQVSVYVDADDERKASAVMSAAIAEHAPGIALCREVLPEIDWVAHSLQGLKPVRAGRFLVHGGHDRADRRPGLIAIEIDAGQAFGTGHHGTTVGCLEMIDTEARRPPPIKRALDLGTGSAVLAIAMRKAMRPATVLASDIDPVATATARANLARNGLRPRRSGGVRVETASGLSHPAFAEAGPYDLIAANILARPLMAMAPAIARHLTPSGGVIVSGILADQRWKVLAAFRTQGLFHQRTLWRDGWVTMRLGRTLRPQP